MAVTIGYLSVEIHNERNPNESGEYLLRHDSEFQLTLDTELWGSGGGREAMVDAFVEYLNADGVLSINRTAALVSIREQFHYTVKKKKCGVKYDIRGRHYVEGYKAGVRYYDIKFSNETLDVACGSRDLRPRPYYPLNLVADTTAKCEHDIHVCKDKWSLETRLVFNETVPYLPYIMNCRDVVTLWPWAIPDMEKQNYTLNELKQGRKLHYWWVVYFKGTIGDGDSETIYQINFTLKYQTIEDAVSGENLQDGSEFSIKIFTKDGGMSEEYDKDTYKWAEQLYNDLADEFGSGDDFDEYGECPPEDEEYDEDEDYED